ncbi:MAG: thioredoxin family protein [Verrucomicrobiae bacterium]|nr:thioredoxin family protein [Verrucomicrobiae bacterium]
MKNSTRFILIGAVILAVAMVVLLKKKPANVVTTVEPAAVSAKPVAPPSAVAPGPVARQSIPRLVDLGAGKCIPCKMMAPILEELKKEYEGRLEVVFIDVWQNPDAGKQYGVKMIPTQIFYDAGGRELFRHTGFFGKEDILAKWKELGVNLEGGSR